MARLNGEVIDDVLAGRLPTEVGRAATYGLSLQRQLLEASGIEERLEKLERRVGSGEVARPWRA